MTIMGVTPEELHELRGRIRDQAAAGGQRMVMDTGLLRRLVDQFVAQQATMTDLSVATATCKRCGAIVGHCECTTTKVQDVTDVASMNFVCNDLQLKLTTTMQNVEELLEQIEHLTFKDGMYIKLGYVLPRYDSPTHCSQHCAFMYKNDHFKDCCTLINGPLKMVEREFAPREFGMQQYIPARCSRCIEAMEEAEGHAGEKTDELEADICRYQSL